MATQRQLRRGTTAEIGAMTPAEGELVYSTDDKQVNVGDGSTAGGTGLQKRSDNLTAVAGLTPTTDNFMQAKSSAWASRTPTQVTADLIAFVGDSGSGGTKGLVPAPASGDAAAAKYLKADGTWATPAGGGGGTLDDAIATSTNDNASAGSLGEYVSSTILAGSQVSLTSTSVHNITSISLTAGDWDVEGVAVFNPHASTTSPFQAAWISSTSASYPTLPNNGGISQLTVTFSTGGIQAHPIPRQRFSLASTTTIYLSVTATFGVNTMGGYGHINARRVR